jgi:cysteine-rich repeat protein
MTSMRPAPSTSSLVHALLFGAGLLVGGCGDDPSGDDGASACVGGEFCVGDLVCVGGFCIPPGSGETNGDGDPGDGDPGDGDPGDGDPGDGDPGDGDPGDGDPGDGDPGDGDGDPGPCGNGVLEGGETCDDGNATDFDGCDADCQPSTIEALAGGTGFTCISFGGAARCWGTNAHGQLGIDSTEPHGQPAMMLAPITNVGANIEALDCGDDHSCAITSAGDVRCWGSGASGRLGYGNVENIGDGPGEMPPSPVDVGGTPVVVGVGDRHTCVVLDTGETRCWGSNSAGQLGYGNTTTLGDQPGEMPPPPVNVGGTPIQLALGYDYTCALLDTGKVRCWGRNNLGQLGYGNTLDIGDEPGEMPPPDVNLGPGVVVELGASVGRNCARFDNGTVRCWGVGPIGYGTPSGQVGAFPGDMPPPILDLAGSAIQLEIGSIHNCVLLAGGNVRCWGSGTNGQLGYGNWNDIGDQPGEMPPADVDVGGLVTRLGLGALHSCALMQSNEVRCWGAGYANGHGEPLGDDPDEMPPPPVTVY